MLGDLNDTWIRGELMRKDEDMAKLMLEVGNAGNGGVEQRSNGIYGCMRNLINWKKWDNF